MQLVYEGPSPSISLNIGEFVTYHRGITFNAEGGYAQYLLHKLHPHRFSVVDEQSETTEITQTPAKRVGRKPKEQ